MTRQSRSATARAWLGLLALAGGACSGGSALLAGAPCPCVAGQVCCEATATCALEGACPSFAPLQFSIDRVTPDRGRLEGGDAVEVHGAGFSADMQVIVGGALCRPTTFDSAARLLCVTPPGRVDETSVSVAVRRPDGAGVERRDAFRYQRPHFSDVTVQAGLSEAVFGLGVTVWDADLDGDRDILLAASASVDDGPILFSNLGGLVFEPAPTPGWVRPVGRFTGATVADFDGDGREDLFVANHRTVPRPHLLRRSAAGDLVVQDLPLAAGLGLVGASALDLDADGAIDVVACRDFDDDDEPFYFGHNEGGVLVDRLEVFGAPRLDRPCRTASPADFDRDGDLDLVFCGERLTLLENRDGALVDVTDTLGLRRQIRDSATAECGSISWVDVDADGDLDIALAPYTNFVTGANYLINSGTLVFENLLESGRASFALMRRLDAPSADEVLCRNGFEYLTPGATLLGGGRSSVWLDVDLDGDQDLLALLPSVYCLEQPWLYESHFAAGEARFSVHRLEPGSVLSHVTGSVGEDLDLDGDVDVVSHQWAGPGGHAVLRNNLVENVGLALRHLVVRAVSDPDGDATDTETSDDRVEPGLTFELDLDGPASGPDFALGRGKLRVVASGSSSQSSNPSSEARFGLGGHEGPVWARVVFPDGSVTTARVEPGQVQVELRDCASAECR